ncbi:MAG TPA: glycosyltransferase family 39 protein [Flavobacteriaceae bacterium]|nr:glycosyltransferase family 39 protein [Flavobacteriaceae bacterium]
MKRSLFYVLLVSAVLLLFHSGKWGVIETSEARYAEISKEMLSNNDYLHPKLLEINHFHKPPVTYYITVLGYKIFGVDEFGARFFLQIAILIQLILIYHITFLLFKEKCLALTAVLIYFSLPLVLISSRNLTTDAYLNTFILTSVYLWLYYKERGKLFLLYLYYLTLGVIFETKGPVGLLFPVIFIISHKIIFKEKIEKNIHQLFGILLFLVVSAAWYLALAIKNPNIIDYFINHQLKDRMLTNAFNRGKPFWFYLVTVPLAGLPWAVILVLYLKSKLKQILKERKTMLVLYVTILAIFVLFSAFDTKLIFYVLPMFGFMAIITAKILSDVSQKTLGIYNKVLFGLGILFLFVLFLADVVNIGYRFNLTFAIVLAISTVIACLLILKYQSGYLKTAALGYLFGCLLLVGGTIILTENQDRLNSTKHAIKFINNQLKDVKNIVVYNYLMPSTKFYSDKPIITLNDGHNTANRETQFETNLKWKQHLIDVRTENGRQRADSILKHESVLISRKKVELPDYLDFLNHPPFQKKEFGKWVIYY